MQVIGNYIRTCRILRGLTQQELGIMCGYTPQSACKTVTSWELGKQYVPTKRLRLLAKALQVPIENLVP